VKHLEYRLHELDDGSAANALWDDLGDAHPDLRALFTNIRARLSFAFADVDELHSRIDSMGSEIDARDHEIARLSDDLEYQRDRTRRLEIELHDATREPQAYKTKMGGHTMTKEIQQVAEDITLRATLRRIKRKADITVMDAPRHTLAHQNATELQLLASIALRCIEGEK